MFLVIHRRFGVAILIEVFELQHIARELIFQQWSNANYQRQDYAAQRGR